MRQLRPSMTKLVNIFFKLKNKCLLKKKSYLPLPLPDCVTLGKAPNVSVPPVKEERSGEEVGAEVLGLIVGT